MDIVLDNSETFKNSIRKAGMDIFKAYLNSDEDFFIIIMNFNDWSEELPEEVKIQESFLINISKWTKEATFINENGDVVLNAAFGDKPYKKILSDRELIAVVNDKSRYVFQKDYIEEDISKYENLSPDKDGIKNSMEAFMKNNKNLNKD